MIRFTFSALIFLLSTSLFAQDEEFKQKIDAFIKAQQDKYEKKYLNIADRELGAIEETEYDWKEKFMLKSLKDMENNLRQMRKRKIYFSIYHYETELDRKYALKFWMENFIEDEEIRAGRKERTYEYATPTIILINKKEIIICNYDCKNYEYDNFDYWEDEMLKYMGEDGTIEIEILCDGPLEWTRNAPDPRTRGLF